MWMSSLGQNKRDHDYVGNETRNDLDNFILKNV